MINRGSHIKCILHGGVIIEGIVESWSKEEAILISLNNEGTLIIPNTSRDIVLIKVISSDENKEIKLPELDQKIENVRKEPFSDLKNKRLAELKILKSKTEKDIVANKLKDHHIGDVRTADYGTPEFFKK